MSLDILKDGTNFVNSLGKIQRKSRNIIDVLKEELASPRTYTISIFYTVETHSAHLVTKGENPKTIVESMTKEDYLNLCREVGVEENEDYNLSLSRPIGESSARVFAITKPISEFPNITISTSKNPPSSWHQVEVEEFLEDIMKDNFIIVGASGAGKTYLFNYLLKTFHGGTNSKIGMIEEFNELLIPNQSTFRLSVPTAKPNEPRLLEFITEQSNLMRIDYLYVGEIKGSEAFPFLRNLGSGTIGGATVHGSSVRDGLDRFKDLCISGGANSESVIKTISKTLKHVVYVRDRQIRHIAKLTGVSQIGVFQMTDVYINESETKLLKSNGGVIL